MRALKRILEHRKLWDVVTKVIAHSSARWLAAVALMTVAVGMASRTWGQDRPSNLPGSSAPVGHPAGALYAQLRSVGLDQDRVYHVRDLSIDREALHITLNDGTLAFTQDVLGRASGAFFEGDGEVLLMPPNQVERASMTLFTGEAILEQKFSTCYFRFNDDTFTELQESLAPAENASDFVAKWNEAAKNLAQPDALRLLLSFSLYLPSEGGPNSAPAGEVEPSRPAAASGQDRMLSVRLQNHKLGTFDLHYDSSSPEQIWAGQLKTAAGQTFYDVWTAFSLAQPARGAQFGGEPESMSDVEPEGGTADTINVSKYKIRAHIHTPTQLDADASLEVEVKQGGQRTLLFELSRALQIKEVELDGAPVEFIQNPALEGTQLARRGNDLVAVIFPRLLKEGQRMKLRFVYGGAVLSEVGEGLLYVGARGLWYPNRGLAMSNFDMEFHYPPLWTLVATGKRQDIKEAGAGATPALSGPKAEEQVSRWVSERPIPLAGFNLGRYSHAKAQAGGVSVTAYAASSVERDFPRAAEEPVERPEMLLPPALRKPSFNLRPVPMPPSPARNEKLVAERSAQAIEAFSRWYGPYPYGELSLTQMPGVLSQGWPSLIYLSTFSFLTPEEKARLKMNKLKTAISDAVVAHETAHQWWGDAVTWSSYHDQWLLEALADYSSLLLIEPEDPALFRAVMASYRDDLLAKEHGGKQIFEAGPITLGGRLSSSQFPDGYGVISYERGTWLLHMMRCMMNDEAHRSSRGTPEGKKASVPDEPFFRALRKLQERAQGGPTSTAELVHAFEQELPRSLRYNDRNSLDWFYQGWVNGVAIPRFEASGVKFIAKNGATQITGTILQKSAPNDLVTSLPVYALVAGRNVFLGRVFADGPETSFRLTAPAGARKIILDPNQTVLARSR
jgi:hypothetical protein